MTRKRILVFLLLLCAFAISFFILTFDVLGEEKAPRIYTISVIVRGKSSDSWASIRQGADQAASEMHVDLSFITLSEENNLAEQDSLLQREFENGVDAVVVSAADSDGLVSTVERFADKIPVVCIESNINSPLVKSYISADNYAMGNMLGEEIRTSGNARKRLAVIDSSMCCDNIGERMAGLMSVLEPIGGKIDHWTLPNDSTLAAELLAKQLAKKETDVVVALDVAALELLGQAAIDANARYLDLFGIGATGKVASFIEQDIVTATIVQNEFNIGYLGVKMAVDTLKKQAVEREIIVEHRVINWKNMYDTENQRLLFPFIR